MMTLKSAVERLAPVLSTAVLILLNGSPALAQSAVKQCPRAQVIPLTGTEPAAKIVVDARYGDVRRARQEVALVTPPFQTPTQRLPVSSS